MRGISWLAAKPVSFSRRTLLHAVSKSHFRKSFMGENEIIWRLVSWNCMSLSKQNVLFVWRHGEHQLVLCLLSTSISPENRTRVTRCVAHVNQHKIFPSSKILLKHPIRFLERPCSVKSARICLSYSILNFDNSILTNKQIATVPYHNLSGWTAIWTLCASW